MKILLARLPRTNPPNKLSLGTSHYMTAKSSEYPSIFSDKAKEYQFDVEPNLVLANKTAAEMQCPKCGHSFRPEGDFT
jgi:hypothetical protein